MLLNFLWFVFCNVTGLLYPAPDVLHADAKKGGPITRFLSKLSAKFTGRPLETPESPSTSSSFISSKLILKVIAVAGIAIVWHFFLE